LTAKKKKKKKKGRRRKGKVALRLQHKCDLFRSKDRHLGNSSSGETANSPIVPSFEHGDKFPPNFIQCVVNSMQPSYLLILAMLRVVPFVAQLNICISNPQVFVCRFNLFAIYVPVLFPGYPRPASPLTTEFFFDGTCSVYA
jgi:hypothetical protein